MIHSKSKILKKFLIFQIIQKNFPNIPLVCVPSTYNKVREKDLINHKFNVVIYANHMLRASYPAMRKVALEILKNERSFEANKYLCNQGNLHLIPGA